MDVEYVVHDNMRSQKVGTMSFGNGTVHYQPRNKKLNTKTLTESELVESSSYVPFNVWITMLMKIKGCAVKKKHIPGKLKCDENGSKR